MARREHARILGDVLDALDRMTERAERVNLASLATGSNLPHDRLVSYLGQLRGNGLVAGDRLPVLTPRGQQFLECYRAWIRIQRIYGIDDDADPAATDGLIGVSSVLGHS